MLLSLRKDGLTSLFKELRVFKGFSETAIAIAEPRNRGAQIRERFKVEPKVRLQGYGYNPFCSHTLKTVTSLNKKARLLKFHFS